MLYKAAVVTVAMLAVVALAAKTHGPFAASPEHGARAAAAAGGQTLRIMVVPHTHADVGWVRTIDEYYEFFTRHTYSTVIREMMREPWRTFQAVEMAYFARWWRDPRTTDELRAACRKFVAAKRFVFTIGGWVMPDEATTDGPDLVQTLAWGHQFIVSTFGQDAAPRFGFQVDPFGASASYAWLSARMGFDAHIISRIDYLEKADMQDTQTLEFMWKPFLARQSQRNSRIFTHVMDQYSYCSPFWDSVTQVDAFCNGNFSDMNCNGGGYEWDGDDSMPARFWRDDMPYEVTPATVAAYAGLTVNDSRARAEWFRTDTLLFPFGCDFQWFNATRMYTNMERIMAYINANNGPGQAFEGVTMEYGTIARYFSVLHAQNLTWGTRDDEANLDFFPYANDVSNTWSGYFTSHSQLKIYARQSAAALRAAESLLAQANIALSPEAAAARWASLSLWRNAVGAVQHHDGMTGTMGRGQGEYPGQIGQIANMYMQDLAHGAAVAEPSVLAAMASMLNSDEVIAAAALSLDQNAASASLAATGSAVVTAYNPLGWDVTTWVAVPLNITLMVQVYAASGVQAPSAMIPPPAWSPNGASQWVLHFQATIPALGSASFRLDAAAGSEAQLAAIVALPLASDATLSVSNGLFTALFSGATQGLQSVTLAGATPTIFQVSHVLRQYHSAFNNSAGSVSGSYIFRPLGQAQAMPPIGSMPSLTAVTTQFLTQVTVSFGPGAAIAYRIYGAPNGAGAQPFIDTDYLSGPLQGNREMIARLITNIDNAPTAAESATGATSVFATDSNGLQAMPRMFNSSITVEYPDPGSVIAGHYYPITRFAYIRDATDGRQVTALFAQAQGGSSLKTGELEYMLHRRALQDDGLGACSALNITFGVHRPDGCPTGKIPLNQTTAVTPKAWLYFSAGAEGAGWPALSQRLNNPPVLFHSAAGVGPDFAPGVQLPANVHLLSLASYNGTDTMVLRLQSLESDSSAPTVVDLRSLVGAVNAVASSLIETTLTVIWPASQRSQTRWNWRVAGAALEDDDTLGGAPNGTVIALGSMDIRTFVVKQRTVVVSEGLSPAVKALIAIAVLAVLGAIAGVVFYSQVAKASQREPPAMVFDGVKRAEDVRRAVEAMPLLGSGASVEDA